MTSIFLIELLSGCGEESGGDDPDPVPMPTISSIDPSSGMVGDEVTITGTNFGSTASENTVTFNGVTASVGTASATQLVVEVPENVTTGPVAVTVGDQTVRGP
ncbi:MAG: IPT/TIG domain-containing protein, partial [Bacteroidota bacterium]